MSFTNAPSIILAHYDTQDMTPTAFEIDAQIFSPSKSQSALTHFDSESWHLWNSDKKTMQPIRITRGTSRRIKKWKQFSQFRWTSFKVTTTEKNSGATFRRWAKNSKEAAALGVTALYNCFCSYFNISNTHLRRPDQAW